jgi:threonine/homoserine efflux transporter RhtA
MDVDGTILTVALTIGFIQLLASVNRATEKLDLQEISLAVFVSSLWVIYEFRKGGVNLSSTYALLGLGVNLYLLNKILLRREDESRRERRAR